jgi:preprotein translocase subunit SecG
MIESILNYYFLFLAGIFFSIAIILSLTNTEKEETWVDLIDPDQAKMLREANNQKWYKTGHYEAIKPNFKSNG